MMSKLSVVKVIQRYMGLPEEVLTDDAHLIDDLGADSLTLTEIMTTLESEYKIQGVSVESLSEVLTIGDIKKFIAKHTGDA